MRKQIGLKLEESLVERVDACAVALGQSRTAFIEAALSQAVWGSPGTESRGVLDVDASGAGRAVRVVPAPRPALRVVGSRGAASSSDAKRGVAPRWRGGKEGSL